jgi:hypothetical protein
MKTIHFPYIALALTSVLLLVVLKGSQLNAEGLTTLPLLTLLIVSEFSFFVTAIGSYIGIKHLFKNGFKLTYAIATALCIFLSVRFMLMGIALWPLEFSLAT